MIYLPKTDYPCYTIQSGDIIRAYHTKPYNPSYNQSVQLTYTDYYINSHYLEKVGTQNFGYNTTLPTCIDSNLITDAYYYRNDFDSIMVVFMCFMIIFFMIWKISLKSLVRGLFR